MQAVEPRDEASADAGGRFLSRSLRALGWSTTAALSPDGKVLAVAGREIVLVELATGKSIGRFEEHQPMLLSFLEEGKLLASVSPHGTVRYWSMEKQAEAQSAWKAFTPDQTEWGKTIAELSPDGRLLIAPSDGFFQVWNLKDRKLLHRFKEPSGHGEFALSPDGNSIATYDEGALVILDAATGKQRARVEFEHYRHEILYSSDGRMIVSCGGYDRYRVRDAATLREICNFEQRDRGHNRTMRFSPDNRSLATTHGDGLLRVWDLQTRQEVCRCRIVDRNRAILPLSLLFTPDGKRMISVEEEGPVVRVWDATSGKEIKED